MSTLYTFNKQQFNADVSFNSNTTFNNTSTQISSSGVVGISGGIVNISGGVINIGGGNVLVGTGNVGIGTTNPEYKLDVSGNANVSGSFNSLMYITTKSFSFNSSAGSNSKSTSQFIGKIFNGGLITVYIKSSGYGHGEGTIAEIFCGYGSHPVVRVVSGHWSMYSFYFIGDQNNGITYIWFNEYVNSGGYNIDYECRIYCNNPSNFYPTTTDGNVPSSATEITNGQFILGNGYVGIGTTSPQRTLTVNGFINSKEIRLVDTDQTISNNTTHMDVGTNGDGHYLWGYGASKALRFATNQSERMRITNDGYVGIGTTSPAYTLDVNGLVRITGYGATYSSSPIANNIYGYLNAYSYNAELTSGTHNDYISVFVTYSIKTNAQIYAENFFGYSDKRIKNNIVDIDDEKALSILRQIKPKTYDYVDKLQRGNNSVIGFIAQEIKEVLPKAVTITKSYVPTFYTNCQVSATDASNIVLVTSPIDLSWNALHDQSGNTFVDADGNACSDASGNKVFNVKLYDQSNNEITCKTTNVLDKRSFLMDVSGSKMVDSSGNLQLESDGTYFLHGQEVDDFHNLDKSAIFTVVTAAVQDIDRKQVLDEAKIVALEAQVASQDARIAALEQAIAALLAK